MLRTEDGIKSLAMMSNAANLHEEMSGTTMNDSDLGRRSSPLDGRAHAWVGEEICKRFWGHCFQFSGIFTYMKIFKINQIHVGSCR